VGYSQSNIGNEVTTNAGVDAIPPRSARLGYTLNPGLDYTDHETHIRIFSIDWSTESLDNLDTNLTIHMLDNSGNLKPGYQGGIGDINIGRNLISREGDDKVVIHRGFSVDLVEFLKLSSGSFYGGNTPLWLTS